MPLMPARFSKAAAALGVGAVLVLGLAAGCEPQVTIVIERGDDLGELPVGFLRFVFRPAGADPIEKGPFPLAGISGGDFAEVPPDTEFSVDVIGCKELDAAACVTENTFIARGCAGGFRRSREESLSIRVELRPANIGNAQCPIEDPASDAFTAEGEGEGEGEGE